jgi:hypothetical protein
LGLAEQSGGFMKYARILITTAFISCASVAFAAGGAAATSAGGGGAHGGAAAAQGGGARASSAGLAHAGIAGGWTVGHATISGKVVTVVQFTQHQGLTEAQRAKLLAAGFKPLPACSVNGACRSGQVQPPTLDYYCRRDLRASGFSCISVASKKT